MDCFSEWSAITNLGNLAILGNFSGLRRCSRRGIRNLILADFFRDDLSRYVSFYVAYQKELAFDSVEYFAEPQNRDLGIVKRSRKPRNRRVSHFPAKTRSPEQFFFQPP